MNVIINMLADITDIFVDIWANKIVDRFARKKTPVSKFLRQRE